jgi:isopenicillin-N N-acyltransferase-like protein
MRDDPPVTELPHVRVAGGPRERGRQYGEATRERIARSLEAYEALFAHYAGIGWDEATAQAARYLEPIERYEPRFAEELRGIAEGAGVRLDDVLALNTRTEVMYAAQARTAEGLRRPSECSAFALTPEATGGPTLVGQNWDWHLHAFETCVVLEAEQDDGRPDYVTVVEAGLLAKAGLNSAGIGLATNALVCSDDRGEPGVPYHVVLRGILDAETISDALQAVQRSVRSSSASYVVAHADGLAAGIESAPGDHSRVGLVFPERGVVLHTNHFLAPPAGLSDVSIWAMPTSPFRLERLRTRIEAARGALTADALRDLLADHANHPGGICCHPDRRVPGAEQTATVVSLVADLDARTLWLADGPPCSTAWRRLELSGFLAKPALARS